MTFTRLEKQTHILNNLFNCCDLWKEYPVTPKKVNLNYQEDISVDDAGVVVKLVCLMAEKENFKVNITPDDISGKSILNIELKSEHEDENLSTKSFKRSWLLPFNAEKTTTPQATYKGGVLTVVVPRPANTLSKIDIEIV